MNNEEPFFYVFLGTIIGVLVSFMITIESTNSAWERDIIKHESGRYNAISGKFELIGFSQQKSEKDNDGQD